MTGLYNSALSTCEKYFSKDAAKFLDRQISAHLKKDRGDLSRDDLPKLGYWCKISAALLLGPGKADELAQEILTTA